MMESDIEDSSRRPSSGGQRSGRRSGRGKEWILAAAAGVVAEHGADRTRFTDVSQACGVPVSTLQYYFGNREDLLVAIFRHECARELADVAAAVASDDDPWEQIVRLVRVGVADGDRSVRTWHTWVEFWRASLRDAELREEAHGVYRRWRESVREVVANGVASGRFGSDVDAAIVSYQLTAIIDGIGIPVALADPGLPAGAEVATGLVIDAIARLLQIEPEQPEGAPDVLEDPSPRYGRR
jgi:AcrR family transcriptional regulator